MIKNIILDMGNVLMDYNPQIPLQQFCKTKEEKQIIEKELFNGPEWIAGDLGTMTNEERYESVKKRVPKQSHEALKNCAYRWPESMKPIEEAKHFIKYIKEKGYAIYILSNASEKFYDYFPRFEALDFFDGIVVSADVHMIKPDEKIYTYLLEKYNLNAQESLFIDDRKDNVTAAIQLGIQGVVYQDNFDEIKRLFSL